MKKIVSLILSLVLVCTSLLALASCGAPKLEGTYSGQFFDAFPEDTLTITIKKNKTVEYSALIEGDSTARTATGAYTIETEEDHGHEVIKFTVAEGSDAMIARLHNREYTYSIVKKNGKKVLSLSGHDSSVLNLTLTEVKK